MNAHLKLSPPEALVWLIIVASFVLGFTALSATANAAGLFPAPWGGWLWAVAVDGFILLGSLTYANTEHRAFALVMVTAGLGASVAFQLTHAAALPMPAGVPDGLPEAIAVVPPLALLLSLEAWRRMRANRQPASEPVSDDGGQVVEVTEQHTRTRRQLAATNGNGHRDGTKKARVLELLDAGAQVSEITEQVGTTRRYVEMVRAGTR